MSIFMSIYILIYIRIIYAIYLRLILEKFSEIVKNSKSFIYYVYNSPFCQVGLALFLFLLLQVILRITFFLLLFFCFFCCYLFLQQSFCETLHGRHNLQKKRRRIRIRRRSRFWACCLCLMLIFQQVLQVIFEPMRYRRHCVLELPLRQSNLVQYSKT